MSIQRTPFLACLILLATPIGAAWSQTGSKHTPLNDRTTPVLSTLGAKSTNVYSPGDSSLVCQPETIVSTKATPKPKAKARKRVVRKTVAPLVKAQPVAKKPQAVRRAPQRKSTIRPVVARAKPTTMAVPATTRKSTRLACWMIGKPNVSMPDLVDEPMCEPSLSVAPVVAPTSLQVAQAPAVLQSSSRSFNPWALAGIPPIFGVLVHGHGHGDNGAPHSSVTPPPPVDNTPPSNPPATPPDNPPVTPPDNPPPDNPPVVTPPDNPPPDNPPVVTPPDNPPPDNPPVTPPDNPPPDNPPVVTPPDNPPPDNPPVTPPDDPPTDNPPIDEPPPVTTTPEPGTLALLGTGLVGLAGVVRRRRKQSSSNE